MNINPDKLPWIASKTMDYLKEKHKYNSLQKIADKVNQSISKIYSVRSANSKASISARLEVIMLICKEYNISVKIENEELKISKGFQKEDYSEKFIIVFWNSELKELKLFKLYHYNSMCKKS